MGFVSTFVLPCAQYHGDEPVFFFLFFSVPYVITRGVEHRLNDSRYSSYAAVHAVEAWLPKDGLFMRHLPQVRTAYLILKRVGYNEG